MLNSVNVEICSNHDDCEGRRAQIKLTKGFSAKESVKGHMVSSFFHYIISEIDSMICSVEKITSSYHLSVRCLKLAGECCERVKAI